jgi:hypothetical protein
MSLKEAGFGLKPSCWKCLFRACFVLPERPEPRERANFALDGDRRKINLRLICTASGLTREQRGREFGEQGRIIG